MSADQPLKPWQFRKANKTRGKNRADRKVRSRQLGSLLETLENRHLLAFSAGVFSDINSLGISANVDSIVELNGDAYFSANDGQTGSELWTSDGTAGGTERVADLLEGMAGSYPSELTVVGSEIFFTAGDESGERDLWKTDGTASGTMIVYDAQEELTYGFERLTEAGDKLFFTAYQINDPDTPGTPGAEEKGQELWVSDGTTSGTMMVQDINPDQFAYGAEGPQELVEWNNELIFTSYDAALNRDIWKSSDGTPGGAVLVADLTDLDTSQLTPLGTDKLFFTSSTATDGFELHVFDDNTDLVTDFDIYSGFNDSNPQDLTAFNGDLYYSADDGSATRHLYVTDGVTFDTNTVGDGSVVVQNPTELTVVGSNLYFAASGGELAVSTSTPVLNASNSIAETDNWAGIVDAVTPTPDAGTLTTSAGSGTAFEADSQINPDDGPGWVANGAKIGDGGVGLTTLAVGDLYISDIDSADLALDRWDWVINAPAGAVVTNLSFDGFASGNEFDLKDDADNDERINFDVIQGGSSVGGVQVEGDELDNWYGDRNAGNIALAHPGGANPGGVRMTFGSELPDGGSEGVVVNAELNGMIDYGRELWRLGSGDTNPTLVENIVSEGSSNPSQLTASGSRLYFSADEPTTNGRELWTSQGAAGNTNRLTDTKTGLGNGDPQDLTDVNGALFFTSEDNSNDRELWTTDGISTAFVENINPSTDDANVEQVLVVGTDIYFVANDGVNGQAVYVADTTALVGPSNPLMIDMTPGMSVETISGLSLQNNGTVDQVWFYNNLGGNSSDGGIYRINISNQNVTLVESSQAPKVLSGDPNDLFVTYDDGVNTFVYFSSVDNEGGELWRSGGSPGNTNRFADINPGGPADGSDPASLTVFNGSLYFAANDGTNGRELWSTDGTTTAIVQDIDPGGDNSNPEQLTVSGSHLYFTAEDVNTNGVELWALPTAGPAVMLDDDANAGGIDDGGGDSFPGELTDIGGVLYFAADAANDVDREPYRAVGTTVTRIRNINTAGATGSHPSNFTAFDGEVYFAASGNGAGANSAVGQELWRTSGTTAVNVFDVPGSDSASPSELAVAGTRLFYSANDENSSDVELWTTGGPVTSGAVQALDLFPGVFLGSNPAEIVEVGGTVYFVGEDKSSGRELFVLEEFTPEVESFVINDGSAQRSQITSVTVTFTSVLDGVTAADFVLRNIDGPDTDVTGVQYDIFEKDFKTVVVMTFGVGAGEAGANVVARDGGSDPLNPVLELSNSLADGNYKLDVLSAGVTDPTTGLAGLSGGDVQFGGGFGGAGNDTDWDNDGTPDAFFRLYGDASANGFVDVPDLFGSFSPAFNSAFGDANFLDFMDANGDGFVDVPDLFGEFAPAFNVNERPGP